MLARRPTSAASSNARSAVFLSEGVPVKLLEHETPSLSQDDGRYE